MARLNEHGQPVGEPVDWSVPPAPERVLLAGTYVRLEPAAPAHAGSLVVALGGPDERDLWTYRPDEPPADEAEMAQRLAGFAADPGSRTWALVPEGHGGAQGALSLFRIDPANGSAEVAAVIYGRALQRSRAATEAIALVATYVFEGLGYRRLEWKCDSLNAPSRAAARRLGFVEEGTFRNALVYRSRNRDTTWFSITDTEWPGVRAAYDAWLDAANFDADGRQRRRLADLR